MWEQRVALEGGVVVRERAKQGLRLVPLGHCPD